MSKLKDRLDAYLEEREGWERSPTRFNGKKPTSWRYPIAGGANDWVSVWAAATSYRIGQRDSEGRFTQTPVQGLEELIKVAEQIAREA